MDADSRTRAVIEEHWRASERGDTDAERAIYAKDAILDYPQSGERFQGRAAISAQRGAHPADRTFTVQRITGHGSLWVSECLITYDGVPSHSVSIMEFADDRVVHETQYFADPFGVPAWRAALAEPMPGASPVPDAGVWQIADRPASGPSITASSRPGELSCPRPQRPPAGRGERSWRGGR
ncbi:nuclear transport factor 2 family protein [Streptomyces sp. NPDC086010]|uniref:nuclear transport factor 2 family protein n=1 Tax=Streptomyces sp. NPDC086010 TaxID=3365745 RepID=UPI0037D8B9DF